MLNKLKQIIVRSIGVINVSDEDIEKGFRAAVAKQASDNPDIKAALKDSAADTLDLEHMFGDADELEDHQDDAPVA